MNRIVNWLRSISLRRIIATSLITVIFLGIPAFGHSPSLQAQAAAKTSGVSDVTLDKETVKRVQQKAEDLGDSPERPIGDTGLGNIRNLGENVPETLELNIRQAGSKSKKELEAIREDVERKYGD